MVIKTDLVPRLTPEEEELAAKREELARLEAQLAEQELLLASLKAELAAFEGLYLRRVGVLYAELDEWNARLAELHAEQAGTPEAKAEAAEARTQAEEAYSAAHGEAAEVQPFTPSPELKKLYREAAKRVHPDAATDEKDRARRERLMKEVNAAYAAGDEEALRRILAGLDTSPDAVQGSGIGADLIRVLRQLNQIRDRIAAIEREIASQLETDLAQLKAKADIAATEGRDLLEEMEASVKVRVILVKHTVEEKSASGADR
jgi:DNA repair exonuclease SbcCD ATPase subunit